jgi:hypothetical protein
VASRLLARAVPLALGAVAAGIWLHRRQLQRPALREVSGELPPQVPPARRAARFARVARRPIDIVTIVDDLLGAAR